MPKKVAIRRDREILLRVTSDEMDTITSAAHLDGVSANAYVYALVQDHVRMLATNGFVQADLANRAAYRRQRGETTTLDRRRRASAVPEERDAETGSD